MELHILQSQFWIWLKRFRTFLMIQQVKYFSICEASIFRYNFKHENLYTIVLKNLHDNQSSLIKSLIFVIECQKNFISSYNWSFVNIIWICNLFTVTFLVHDVSETWIISTFSIVFWPFFVQKWTVDVEKCLRKVLKPFGTYECL